LYYRKHFCALGLSGLYTRVELSVGFCFSITVSLISVNEQNEGIWWWKATFCHQSQPQP